MRQLILLILSCTLAAIFTAQLGAAEDQEFYRGKQIRIVVSTDAGGAYDTYARLLAQVIRGHSRATRP